MSSRRPALLWGFTSAGTLGLVALVMLAATSLAQPAADGPRRIAFQISTGATLGTFFPVGELLAGLLSHPPGIGRCETEYLCGPAGLIVNTRTTLGSIANVQAVNSGLTNSAVAQIDVVKMAIAGEGPFAGSGRTAQIRVIANLYGQDVHLVAAADADILNVADLRGKRVSISNENSDTIIIVRAILAAYRLPEWRFVANFDPADRAAQLLRNGELDAFFFVGGTPVTLIEQLLSDGVAVLIPIDGAGRDRLLAQQDYLSVHTIPQDTYSATPPVDTVSVEMLWITHVEQPDDLIYAMTKALYHPLNRAMIEPRVLGTNFLELDVAAENAVAPLHLGAARFFTEAGVLGPPNPAVPNRKPI